MEFVEVASDLLKEAKLAPNRRGGVLFWTARAPFTDYRGATKNLLASEENGKTCYGCSNTVSISKIMHTPHTRIRRRTACAEQADSSNFCFRPYLPTAHPICLTEAEVGNFFVLLSKRCPRSRRQTEFCVVCPTKIAVRLCFITLVWYLPGWQKNYRTNGSTLHWYAFAQKSIP